MFETSDVFQEFIKDGFAAVAEGAVTEVMGKADNLGEAWVCVETSSEDFGQMGNLEGMGKSGSEVIGFKRQKYLGFVA
jgi:hypothetical protein